MGLSQPPGARGIAFAPVVLAWDPPHELRWRATLISHWLFSGEQGFRLEPIEMVACASYRTRG